MKTKISFLICILFFAATTFAWETWTNNGANNLWTNSANWNNHIVPNSPTSPNGDVYVNSVAAGKSGPLIVEGDSIDVWRMIIANASGPAEVTINGGTLTANSYLRISMINGMTGILNINGGVLNHPASGTPLALGYSGIGILNMTGGELNAASFRYPATATGKGLANIYGGTITCNSLRVGASSANISEFNLHGGVVNTAELRMYSPSVFNITEHGTFIYRGSDQTTLLTGYVSDGRLKAFEGRASVIITYDITNNETIVTTNGSYTKAWNSYPADGELYATADTLLQWSVPLFDAADPNVPQTPEYDVYFGTAGNMTKVATVNQTMYNPTGNLAGDTDYQWRIDVVDPSNGQIYSQGDVWSFRVPLAKVDPLSPQDAETNVHPDTLLAWTSFATANGYYLYISNDQQLVADGDASVMYGPFMVTTYDADIDWNQTYYWRVDVLVGENQSNGQVWSFSTISPQCTPALAGDTNGDCTIDLLDFANLAASWLDCTRLDCQ